MITDQFSKEHDMITDQFSKEHDMPTREVLLRYAICSTPRSGSHFLGHLMKARMNAGHPLEYFHERHFEVWQKRRESSRHTHILPYLESIRTTPNGVFGIKIHFGQLNILEQHISIRALIASYKFVHVLRKNALAQAVSYARASQTGAWISGMPEIRKPNYDRLLILEKLRDIYRDNASWECLFSLYQVDFHKIYYEDLLENTNQILQNVATFLNLETSNGAVIQKTFLPKQQSDSINQEWIERFLTETQDTDIMAKNVSVCQHQETAPSNNQQKNQLFSVIRDLSLPKIIRNK